MIMIKNSLHLFCSLLSCYLLWDIDFSHTARFDLDNNQMKMISIEMNSKNFEFSSLLKERVLVGL